jgi:hypothetical protein
MAYLHWKLARTMAIYLMWQYIGILSVFFVGFVFTLIIRCIIKKIENRRYRRQIQLINQDYLNGYGSYGGEYFPIDYNLAPPYPNELNNTNNLNQQSMMPQDQLNNVGGIIDPLCKFCFLADLILSKVKKFNLIVIILVFYLMSNLVQNQLIFNPHRVNATMSERKETDDITSIL